MSDNDNEDWGPTKGPPTTGGGGHLNWDKFNARDLNKALGKWLKKREPKRHREPYRLLDSIHPSDKKKKKK